MPARLPADHDDRMARARLSLAGLALGDAFGECFFRPGMQIRLNRRELPDAPWFYTDDTMMACGVVEVLAAHGRIDQDALAAAFARRFREQPNRGYGWGAMRLLTAIDQGARWDLAAPGLFNGQGSMGNGGAMRVAPVGAYFADDLERIAAEARASAEVTHAHPDGQAGAVAVAIAAALVTRDDLIPPKNLLQTVIEWTPDNETRNGLMHSLEIGLDAVPEAVAATLGSGQRVLSSDTVPFAVWMAAHHTHDYQDALWATASGFGDVDTTCAMVGGIVALAVGEAGLPQEWRRRCEPVEE